MRSIVAAMLMVSVFVLSAVAFTACSAPEANVAEIQVPSVQCESCAMTIDKALKKLDGVKEVNVDLKKNVVKVTYFPERTEAKKLELAIVKAGYEANGQKADAEAYADLPDCCKLPQKK